MFKNKNKVKIKQTEFFLIKLRYYNVLEHKYFNKCCMSIIITIYLAPGIFDNTLVRSTPVKA